MNFKMNYDVRYIVNDDCVVAIASPLKRDKTTHTASKILRELEPNRPLPNVLRCEYKGIARHKSTDKVDIELAKEIAKKKAIRKATKAFSFYNKQVFKRLMHEMVQYKQTCESMDAKIETFDKEIFDMT